MDILDILNFEKFQIIVPTLEATREFEKMANIIYSQIKKFI